ncbi:hypothetical protein [uncultured Bartonella sp.]|uniref:hypothetical protein n=1 Tax=uncultured Bartonella sp. TaxID=104108 RepID=UPI0025F9A440|nr:hypothetical protein [uncultured Bartonella sp.]
MISFPRPLPAIKFTTANFELQRFVSTAKSGGQLINIIEYADPCWKFTAKTSFLRYSDGQMMNAWLDSFRGGLGAALIRHPHYCCPRAHINNRGPETRPGKLTAIANGDELTVSTVHAGLVLSAGDYVSLQYDRYYALTRVVDATGGGTNRTIVIEPNLPGYIQTGATVLFDRAELLMRLDITNVTQWSRDNEDVSFTFVESRL